MTAILADILVARENIPTGKPDLRRKETVEGIQYDNLGQSNPTGWGVHIPFGGDTVIVAGECNPSVKIIEGIVFGMHYPGMPLEEKRQRAFRGSDIYRYPRLI